MQEIENREVGINKDFPLSQERLAGLISAGGNNELKALALTFMGFGTVYTDFGLRQHFAEAGVQIPKSQLFSYCKASFAPIGFIAKEVVDPTSNVYGYMLTEYGRDVGIPLAGLLLKWSVDHPNFNLYQVFGRTGSPVQESEGNELDKKRSALTRLKILREIATNLGNPLRQADIVTTISGDQVLVSKHLQNMARLGLISYESKRQGEPFSFYQLPSNEDLVPFYPVRNHPTVSQRAYEVFWGNPDKPFSLNEIEKILTDKYPQYQTRSNTENRKNVTELAAVLAEMARNRVLKRSIFHHEVQSQISLTIDQQEAIVSLIEMIDKFQKGDPKTIQQGILTAQTIVSDPNILSGLIQKAREASPKANAQSLDETFSYISSILIAHPNSNARQINDLLESLYNKKLTKLRVNVLLSKYMKEGRLKANRTKSGIIYNLAESNDNNNT